MESRTAKSTKVTKLSRKKSKPSSAAQVSVKHSYLPSDHLLNLIFAPFSAFVSF